MFGELLLLVLFFSDANCLSLDKLATKNCSKLLDIPTQIKQDGNLHGLSGVSQCPPWFLFDNQSRHCKPGDSLGGIVHQDSSTLQTSILGCYCMTEEEGAVTVGACMYACSAVLRFRSYYPLPCNVSELWDVMCADLNRRGRLCGECMKGYTVPAYSYDPRCIKCEDYKYNWLKYLAAAFLPLTVFYVVVTLFSISFTSPLLSGVVLAFQIVANQLQLQLIVLYTEAGDLHVHIGLFKILMSVAAFINLDFFRPYFSLCLHLNVSALTIVALNYAIAVYPIFLIGVTFAMVKLYDHNFRPLVWIWKPLGCIVKPLRREWDVRTSLVDVFASFIYLSSSRIFCVSTTLLVPATNYHQRSDGHMQLIKKHYLYMFPSVEFFSKEHIPFAVLATTMLFMFCILPMILLFVYPFHWFQQFLNKVGFNSLLLRIFMDVFQGSYKDGTNGTRDYRYFSGLFLLLQLTLTVTLSQTLSYFYFSISSIWVLIYLVLHAIFQPFKRRSHNIITSVMILPLMYYHLGQGTERGYVHTYLMIGSSVALFLYLLGLVCVALKKILCREKCAAILYARLIH